MPRFAMEFEKPIVDIEEKLSQLKNLKAAGKEEISQEIAYLEEQLEKVKEQIYSRLTAWQKVQVARHPERPRTLDYIEALFNDFVELHGERLFGDDHAIVAGPAYFEKEKVMIVGHQKGKDARDNIRRNFGMPHPEGYRKALRLMRLAAKFDLPILCFIDTPGAYPGAGAEERGQSGAIAQNLMEMSSLPVSLITINIGEGGSGGALGLGVGDRIIMLENSYYSVISPEGCASILWHDEKRAPEAAAALKLTAADLKELEIIDEIVREPLGGAHHDPEFVMKELKKVLEESLVQLKSKDKDELLQSRYKRLREIGIFEEKS